MFTLGLKFNIHFCFQSSHPPNPFPNFSPRAQFFFHRSETWQVALPTPSGRRRRRVRATHRGSSVVLVWAIPCGGGWATAAVRGAQDRRLDAPASWVGPGGRKAGGKAGGTRVAACCATLVDDPRRSGSRARAHRASHACPRCLGRPRGPVAVLTRAARRLALGVGCLSWRGSCWAARFVREGCSAVDVLAGLPSWETGDRKANGGSPLVQVVGKGTASFGKRHNKSHTLCRRCGKRSYHIQKSTCAACGYPSAHLRNCTPPPDLLSCPPRSQAPLAVQGGLARCTTPCGGSTCGTRGWTAFQDPGQNSVGGQEWWRLARAQLDSMQHPVGRHLDAGGKRQAPLHVPDPALTPHDTRADNWGVKAQRRRTTGTGRCRYLKTLPRKFKVLPPPSFFALSQLSQQPEDLAHSWKYGGSLVLFGSVVDVGRGGDLSLKGHGALSRGSVGYEWSVGGCVPACHLRTA